MLAGLFILLGVNAGGLRRLTRQNRNEKIGIRRGSGELHLGG